MQLTFEKLIKKVSEENIPIYEDSRKVTPNSIFIAHQGTKADGRAFIYNAITNGARYVIVEGDYALPDSSVYLFCVKDIQKAEAQLAQARNHTEHYKPFTIGITGTNGKTTSAFLLEYFFNAHKKHTGVLGTINYRFAGEVYNAPLTTPSCLELHNLFGAMQKKYIDTVIMEVSSHALEQRRTEGIAFNATLFTNLTQDHLDYHKNMQEYFEAKALLFERNINAYMAINADDPYGQELLQRFPKAIAYTLQQHTPARNAILHATIKELSTKGLLLLFQYQGIQWEFHTHLIGKFNAYNIAGVTALLLHCGYSMEDCMVLQNYTGTPGRLERIDNTNCFVDYAHTPDALLNVLQTLREVGFKRIITVFGCGGDRDTSKRSAMRLAVEQLSDYYIITSDNPRTESQDKIVADMLAGSPPQKPYSIENDRKVAIYKALDMAKPDDAVLIAGKGHETYQIIGDEVREFSDQATVRSYYAQQHSL